MNTIFCLVSHQAMANVLPALMYKPENVVLFTTPEEKECADNLDRLFQEKNIKVDRNDGMDAYDYSGFKESIKKELDKYSNEVWLNVTGGTKLMALAAYEAFAEKDKRIIYCNTERNQIIHLFPQLKTEKLNLDLSIQDYLKSYGYAITASRTNQMKQDYSKLFDILNKKNILIKFAEFLDKFRSESLESKHLKTYNDKKDRIFTIQKTALGFVLMIGQDKFKYDDDKFLKGDWLEYFMLEFLKKIGIKSELGIKIISLGNVENEIDLIFVKNYQLYLISCKSGRNTDPNKDIYEIETLRNVAGGTFGKAFLLTTKPLSSRISQRCKELKVKSLNLTNIFNWNFN